MIVDVKMEGLDEVIEALSGDATQREARAILKRTANKITADLRREARLAAPSRYGILRKAIRSRSRRGSRGVIESVVYVTTSKTAKHDAFYWRFIEFGTKFTPARPFIEPAMKRVQANISTIFRTEFFVQFERQIAKRAKR